MRAEVGVVTHQEIQEDRIKVVAEMLSRLRLDQRLLSPSGRLPHDIARALAEQVIDVLATFDRRASRE
ncbi:hypothetical protein MZTS_18935 [Methylorubrum zatmanii]|nr:hypothetical protein [Methylorubrum zatmanii]